MVGPSFSRIYDAEIGRFGKFKHIIEPRVDYNYVSDVTDPAAIPTYDEIDLALGRNDVRYAIVNRLLARPADPKKGSAEEIASLEISQTHSFQLPQSLLNSATSFQPVATKDGPVETVLRLSPGSILHFDGRMDLRHPRLPGHRRLGHGGGLLEGEHRQRDLVREPAGPDDASCRRDPPRPTRTRYGWPPGST